MIDEHRFSKWLCGIKIFIVVGSALALLSACSGSDPRIVVEPATQDLGKRPQEPLQLTYTVRNEGGSLLQIQKISTSCGCTRASVDQESIPPGGSTLVRVTLDPTEDDLYGNILRVIYIRSNDPENPEVEVEFRVTIQKPREQDG